MEGLKIEEIFCKTKKIVTCVGGSEKKKKKKRLCASGESQGRFPQKKP